MQQGEHNVILDVTDIQLSFGGIRSLDNVSFQMKKGEILSIIGPNGAGKTCLLNCISGHYKPQKGRIGYKEHNLATYPAYRIARLGVSRTFQNPSLYAQMSALENLLAARYIHTRSNLADALLFFGRSRQEEMSSRKAVDEIISFTHIEELRNRPVAVMSFGQRKQVEIARALVMQPDLLLLDEPMSGLDDIMKEIVAELIIKIQKKGVSIVIVEHDMEVVMGLSDSVVVLDFGQKIAEGTPEYISRDSRVLSAYLGGDGN